ncbi:uncharacterized protein L199_006986 [Kwoniella botswanensis]|uniref:uncharacterized protein n=1 Tax=Kwoniella botswanensis TaxID=1268659 RepID=UPI00315D2258
MSDSFYHTIDTASSFWDAVNRSTESLCTVATEYSLSDNRITTSKDNLNSALVSGTSTKSGEGERSEVLRDKTEDRVKCFLATFTYLAGPASLEKVPETHSRAGSYYIKLPTRPFTATKKTVGAEPQEREELDSFYRVFRERLSEDDHHLYNDPDWQKVKELDFSLIPGESLVSLMTRSARWAISDHRHRMKLWVETQITKKFGDRKPNFDHKQYTDRESFVNCLWPDRLDDEESIKPMELDEIAQKHQEEWGCMAIGDKPPFKIYNGAGENCIVIPEIKPTTHSPVQAVTSVE